MLNVKQKICEFLLIFLSLALRLSLGLGMESDCQFSAFIENDLNLVNHKYILHRLAAKNLLCHQKFKDELNTVFIERLTFFVAYPAFCFRRYSFPNKILLQFLEFQ